MNEVRWIIEKSLRFRYLVVFIAAVLVIFGIGQIRTMPIDVFPEFAPPRVEIQTPSLGLSSAEVESLVTIPLEEALAGVPGLDVMRSKSVEQLSSILLIFKPTTDLMEARQLVQERLALATSELPTWTDTPMMLPPLSSTARTMKIGISSNIYSVMDLSDTAYWKIKQRLLRVRGVANVAMWGERTQDPYIQVEPERLATYGVSMDEILQVTSDTLGIGLIPSSKGAIVGNGGFLETPNQRLPIGHFSPTIMTWNLASIPINHRTKEDGSPLLLGDVSRSVEDTWPMIGDAVVNDGPGLLLVVEKFPWANSVEVTKGVEAAIDEMRPGLPNIDIDTTIFRPATFVETAMENLNTSLIFGAILVLVVLLIFLWDWRVALVCATIIPVTAVITLFSLSLFGTTLNVMVLAGLVIAIGAVVDDAIIGVENIVRRIRQYRRERSSLPTETIVLEASFEVRKAIVSASIIEIICLLPIFFMQGLSGAFFIPLAQAFIVATLVSTVIALTLTPALIMILLSHTPLLTHESPIIPWLKRNYNSLLTAAFKKPRYIYATTVLILVAGITILPFLGQELLPSFKERDFLMHWLTKPGTSHPEMVRISTKACQELRTIPGIRNCGSHIGQALFMDEVYGVYFGENWVSVDSSVDYDKTLAKIQELVDGYPGLYRDVQTYLKERIREVLTGSSYPIVVRIYGQDLNIIREKAEEVEKKIARIPGLADSHVELVLDIPQIEIEVDLVKAQTYGLKPGDVRRTASYMMSGEAAGDIPDSDRGKGYNRGYNVNIWSAPTSRDSLTDIHNMYIATPDGKSVRLAEVADVRIVPIPNAINHENMARRINVEVDIKGRDLGSAVADVEKVLNKITFPRGYHSELVGEYAERQAADRGLLYAGVVACLAIFVMLRMSLGGWRLAVISFLSLPMAMIGGLLAAFFFNQGVLSLGSLVGFLTILGVTAQDDIMLISHFQRLEDVEGEPFGPKLVLRGTRERLAPMMMTALAPGLALVPLAASGNLPGHEIEHPMAIVILGGLVTSTFLNLFLLPLLYLRFGSRYKPAQRDMVKTKSSKASTFG